MTSGSEGASTSKAAGEHTASSPPVAATCPPDPLIAQHDHMLRTFAEQRIDVEKVTRVLAVFVTEQKARGSAPEAVLVELKSFLAREEAPPPDGPEAIRAFKAARDSAELYGAIITLAIAQYFVRGT